MKKWVIINKDTGEITTIISWIKPKEYNSIIREK